MRNLILIGLGLAGLAASPAQAGNSLYGVQTLASLRNCGGATAGDECPGGQRLRPFATDGGLWRATADSGYVETRSIPQRGSFGRGKGELAGDGLALPVLHYASFSAASATLILSALPWLTAFDTDSRSSWLMSFARFSVTSCRGLCASSARDSEETQLTGDGIFVKS